MSNGSDGLRFASTFLSYAGADRPLVEAVAKELMRRGVLLWFDKMENLLGPLSGPLERAIQAQATTTIFLSESSSTSGWCNDEHRWALEGGPGIDNVFPIYLGNREELIRKHHHLRTRFFTHDALANQRGVVVDVADSPENAAKQIADEVASAIYKRVIPDGWREIAIVIEQRGGGMPNSQTRMDRAHFHTALPVLVFRPNGLAALAPKATVLGDEWTAVTRVARAALSASLKTMRDDERPKVHLFGAVQTSLMWAFGRYLDRTHSIDLHVYGKKGLCFSNAGQSANTPLQGGRLEAAETIIEVPAGGCPRVAIGVGGRPEEYFEEAKERAREDEVPLLWIDGPGDIHDSAAALQVCADLRATILDLRKNHDTREVLLFWTTANQAAALAASNTEASYLRGVKIHYMEWNHATSSYELLVMP